MSLTYPTLNPPSIQDNTHPLIKAEGANQKGVHGGIDDWLRKVQYIPAAVGEPPIKC